MGGLPGWWLGVDDGRKYAPTATPREWHSALRKSGFGGIDAITPKIDGTPWPFSIMASQAVDNQMLFLRRPLSSSSSSIYIESLAFSRSIKNEATHISLNHLDVSDLDDSVSRTIAEQLLRQCALEEWEHQQLLWSKEPETFLDRGKLMVPRLLHNVEQNARMNSSRRIITKTVPISRSNISISQSASSPPFLIEDALAMVNKDQRGLMRVKASILMALGMPSDAFLFLGVCRDDATGRTSIGLSTTNSSMRASIVTVPAEMNRNKSSEESLVTAITSELLAAAIVRYLPPESNILVHCTGKDRFLAAALLQRAAARAICVTLLCDVESNDDTQDPSWIRLSARSPRYVVRGMLLSVKPTHFLDLAAHSPNDLSVSLAQNLPSSYRQIDSSNLFQRQAVLPLSFDRGALRDWLEDAVTAARTLVVFDNEKRGRGMILRLHDFHDRSTRKYPTSLVHWPADGEVNLVVCPIEARSLFSMDKTYVLIGLTGQIGQSLCDWLVSHGAGCVCLTSRRPNKIDRRWLESLDGTEANVKIFSMDVTDKDSLNSVLRTIKATFPPIAGVANGAMVLSDALLTGMSFEAMRTVLRPKIEGSYNLDQAFYNDDLDFFVLFSSGACVMGNSGQANYAAANGYLNGLARQRRRRGLAAFTLDIGLVAGIGYVETARQHVVDQLGKYGMTVLSESDFRRAFAKSILAGYVKPEDKEFIPDAVVTTRIRTMTDEETNVAWYNNPVFSHCIIGAKSASTSVEGQNKNKVTALPVAEQLSRAASKEKRFDLLQGKSSNKYSFEV